MPTPSVPTLTLCDQLVATIQAAWNPSGADGVERAYDARIDDKHAGRRVYVFPDLYSIAAADREEDLFRHQVGIVVAERYPASFGGPPLLEWADDRVKFVYDRIVRGLDFAQGGLLKFDGRAVWTESIDEVTVYNEAELLQNRLFLSDVRMTFAEHLP